MSTEAPSVSIAIRAYRRQWLPDAIESVLAQSWRDLELVVYDDAGDLEDVVRVFQDSRIRYQRAKARYSASGRFLAAAALCRGRYLGMLDDDDRYEPEFIERLMEVLESDPHIGVAFCRTTWEADGVRHVPVDSRSAGRQQHAIPDMISRGRIVTPSVMLMRRTAFDAAQKAQPMPDGVAPDVFLNIRIAVGGWHHWLVDERLAICRWHAGQLSRASTRDLPVATWQALQLDDAGHVTLRQQQLARALLLRALMRCYNGDASGAQNDTRAAREAWPSMWWTARQLLRIAAHAGRIGQCACAAFLSLPAVERRRTNPPTAVGHWRVPAR